MVEVHGALTMIPSEVRGASEGLNTHRLVIVVSGEFSDAHDVNWRRRIVKSIFEVVK